MRLLSIPILMALATPALAADAGETLYLDRCATCHGVLATGDGPMAALLSVPVPDLTGLAARNQGVYPLADVLRTIDGRNALRGHGGPMPVFGMMLGGDSVVQETPDGEEIQTRTDVLAIARYLESLQAQ